MNHRERILAAIHHQQPDRVPLDLGGMRSTGIMAQTYRDLKEYLNMPEGDLKIFDPTQQLAYVEENVREKFGCDVLILDEGLLNGWREYQLPDGTPAKICGDFRTIPDGKGGEFSLDNQGRKVRHRPRNSFYFDPIYFPLKDARNDADIYRFSWPVFTHRKLKELRQEAQRLFQETDYAVLGTFGGSFLETGQDLRGWELFMSDLIGNPLFSETLLDKMLEIHLKNLELYLDAVGDFIQIIQVGGDLGTQDGPQISPDLYHRLIQPRQKILWNRVHQLKPGVAVFLHSCGAIYDFIPGIIEAGCDILNPVQLSARGMELARLKKEFGEQLCFWGGGCDTQKVLPFGTPGEVYQHTSRNVEILKTGGGFVFSQVHNIQANVPPENIVAMFRAVQDNWDYGEDVGVPQKI